MESPQTRSSTKRWVTLLLVLVLFSLPIGAIAVVVSSNIYFLEQDVTESEDVYVAATSARVFGTIDGDLIAAAGDVTIGGTVTGDLLVVSQGPVTIIGTVGGSVRGLARDVVVTGTVGGDVAVTALNIEVSGEVGRDVLMLAGTLDVTGTVTRDVLGRVQTADLNGRIGGDVDVLISRLALSSEAEVAGSVSKLPSRSSFIVRSVLVFVTLIHFLSFVFAGLLLLWLFQPSTSASVAQVLERPWRSIGVGLLTFITLPVVIVLLVFSLVGIPVGVLLLVLLLLSLFFAPIPAVTAFGYRLLYGRGALFGGFVVGALIWRGAIWLVPLIPVFIYAVSAVAGLGGFVLAIFERRRGADSDLPIVPTPATIAARDASNVGSNDDWVPPLAPASGRSVEIDESVADGEAAAVNSDEDDGSDE
jgi:hypothetical protein